ncbi:MAG: hypothetical protein L0Z62_19470 [Gemmataceae bacterium]|nr:hypothetical protein [Gemmataceae bacterium]
MGLLHDLDDGAKREITEQEFDYFLDVLPPVAFAFTWNGERWSFGFAEGYDSVYAFQKQGGKYYAQKTHLMNPYECGIPLERQLASQRLLARPEAPERGSRRWMADWIRLGKQNPWIRRAVDPPFNTQSFHECKDDNELLDKFAHGNWCLGQAFTLGDLCFIQQLNGGDEWLAIKQDTPFESISFGRVIEQRGREAAQAILDRIRAAGVERCRELDY